MREFAPIPSLSGSLLLAHPNLSDPNFRRSVLYLSAHEPEDGAIGFILNRFTEKSVGDYLPQEDLGPLASVPVFLGGPVATDRLSFASFRWNEEKEVLECRAHLEAEEAAGLAEQGASVRAFVGYSGWAQHQLEGELQQRSWIVRPAVPNVADIDKCLVLWPETMRGLGPWFRLMAAAPDDPSLN